MNKPKEYDLKQEQQNHRDRMLKTMFFDDYIAYKVFDVTFNIPGRLIFAVISKEKYSKEQFVLVSVLSGLFWLFLFGSFGIYKLTLDTVSVR